MEISRTDRIAHTDDSTMTAFVKETVTVIEIVPDGAIYRRGACAFTAIYLEIPSATLMFVHLSHVTAPGQT